MVVDRRPSNRHNADMLNIPAKANRILNIVLIAMLLIIMRTWHLAVVQYPEKLEESRKPQRRVVLEPAKRATIRDRFNLPLAINKVRYNAAILYSQINQIPSVVWETDPYGNRVKRFKRKEYVTALANLFGKELALDAERIEDLIYAKASFYNQIPFIIKEDISEREYYRLKMLEKDWLGVQVQRIPQRYYPMGKVAGDIVGYMGAINSREYEVVIRETKALEGFMASVDSGESLALPEGLLTVGQVRRRLKDLHELSYSINDSIGKSGIEGQYEEILRGFRGKRSYYSDARGNFLRELPGTREPLSGKRILLTISSELQEYAEQLLIQNEKIRQTRLSRLGKAKRTVVAQKLPWIKGGAIIAMDPKSGEILAMASHPRFDPNDFIPSGGGTEFAKIKRSQTHKWLESDVYLAEMWDQLQSLDRECFDSAKGGFYSEGLQISWNNYLDIILSEGSPLKNSVLSAGTVFDAAVIQKNVENLQSLLPKTNTYALFNALYRGDKHKSHGMVMNASEISAMEKVLADQPELFQSYMHSLKPYLAKLDNTYEQVLFVDLMRLAVNAEAFSDELLAEVGRQSLSSYKETSAAMVEVNEVVKKMSKDLFHELNFKEWRKANEKEFLKKKREEEKILRRYARPYIDYLDSLENEMFLSFWQMHRWRLFAAFLMDKHCEACNDTSSSDSTIEPYVEYFQSWFRELSQGAHQEIKWAEKYAIIRKSIKDLPPHLTIQYLKTLRGFQDLNRPLLGKYRYVRKNADHVQQEMHLASSFYPKNGYGYGRSQAYRQATTQGSIFKLVTAYEALVQRYRFLEATGQSMLDLNPLDIVDHSFQKGKDSYLGYHADGQPLPQFYKGGRLPRSSIASMGRVDLLKALELSSNPYFALLAGDYLQSPQDLLNAAKMFSFGSRTGISLPGEISGNIPEDVLTNRTGLYAFAIGQHTLVVTPLQTSVMLSAMANGGEVLKPKLVELMVGREPKRGGELVAGPCYFPYQQSLELVNIDFPLFIAADAQQQNSLIKRIPTEVKRQIFLPDAVRRMLLDGMCRVVARTHEESLKSLSSLYRSCPEAINDYIDFKYQLVGKTSTSESIENIDFDLSKGTNIYTHVWFGGIVYDKDIMDKKEHRFLLRNSFGDPELVVVIYLRYGGYGKEAAPLAAQMAKKWREIKQQREKARF